jgi:spermidine/putrescine-binding protein
MKRHLIATALLALSTVAVQAQEISFGIISTDAAAAQRDRWEPFFRDMEKKTGLTVKSFYAPDYAGVIEAMRFNKIQVAWYGNKSAMEAVDRAQGEVFAQVMYADGSFGYNGLLITHKDSPYKTLDDVFKNAKTTNLGIGDPNSTSGYQQHRGNRQAGGDQARAGQPAARAVEEPADPERPLRLAQGSGPGREGQAQGLRRQLRQDRPSREGHPEGHLQLRRLPRVQQRPAAAHPPAGAGQGAHEGRR